MPRDTSWWEASRVTSWSRNRTVPALGLSILEMARSVVVLPAPLAPIRATTFPSGTSSETPRSAWMPP